LIKDDRSLIFKNKEFKMRKLLALSLTIMIGFALIGCPEYQLRDDTQVSNLEMLQENYKMQMESFEEGEVTAEFLVESFSTLLDSSYDLEDSKGESWQDHAVDEGWQSPEEEAPEE